MAFDRRISRLGGPASGSPSRSGAGSSAKPPRWFATPCSGSSAVGARNWAPAPFRWRAFARKPIMAAGGTGAIDTHLRDASKPTARWTAPRAITLQKLRDAARAVAVGNDRLVWIDERPNEEVYSELLARTIRERWPYHLSATPRSGRVPPLVSPIRFLSEPSADRSGVPHRRRPRPSTSAPTRREELAGELHRGGA